MVGGDHKTTVSSHWLAHRTEWTNRRQDRDGQCWQQKGLLVRIWEHGGDKCRGVVGRGHGITSQNMELFITIAVRTSNPACNKLSAVKNTVTTMPT
jgi:hypothetical protein